MGQKFQKNGTVIPFTKILAIPCEVTQIKTIDKDKYSAIQISDGKKKKELRTDKIEVKKGDKLDVTQFKPGDPVKVTGTSKGKGFQGVVKRHGFHGSLATHGHKDQLRMPGSIGATGPARVFKGTKMGGQMGNKKATSLNLEIIEVNKEKNELLIKGAVPGARNSLVEIYG